MRDSTIFGKLMRERTNGEMRKAGRKRNEAKKPNPKTEIVNLVTAANVELFHDQAQVPFATIPIEGHFETYAINSKSFRTWLSRLAYKQAKKAASSTSLTDALNLLQGIALFDGPEIPVETRVAAHGGNLYLDLGDGDWRAVEITPTGWRIVNKPPVRFRRPGGMFPIPEPHTGGTISLLRPFVNSKSEPPFRLIVSWLLAALRPGFPFPVLLLRGGQGSAKSTLARLLRSLIDPRKASLRGPPRNDHDLIISATNAWICSYDNLTYLPQWLSDAFCCLATGGGFATRTLYSDSDETIFEAKRPLILTGIGEVVTRGDLLDRCISIDLDPIDDSHRMTEAEVDREFNKFRPQILGALLDAAVVAQANVGSVNLPEKPRMADFFEWAVAGAPAFGWQPTDISAAFNDNRANAIESVLADSVIYQPLEQLLAATNGEWTGTMSNLLKELTEYMPDANRNSKSWPRSSSALGSHLARIAPALRAIGISFHRDRVAGSGQRLVTLCDSRNPPSQLSHPPHNPENPAKTAM